MSKKIKNEQKKFLGETLNQYDKALDEAINQLDKKNREQNHKISSLVNSFDNEYLEKDVEGNMTTLENSKDGMVIINEIQGSTEVNYCKDGEKELILNGDIDTQGESFVTITESVDGGLVDVSLEGNTEINLSKTKDPVLVTREFDDINCNAGKLQYTIDDVTTINDEPGKVDIDRIVGDTMVNHAVNGSEELILNAHINESGDNNITLNGVTSDGGKVDVALEGNTLVNVSKTKDSTALPLDEELTYLYANTQYTVQFIADKAITADITLGGTPLLSQSIVVGLNRISITTPSELVDNKLVINGVGANIREVVVTDIDRELIYFEGMKSVGECEDLAITSANSDNTLSNTQQLTHEPLRAVGEVKDRYVLIDGKWYIERNCGEYIITDVSGDEWNILEYSTGSFLNGNPRNYSHKPNSECICDKLKSLPISTNNIPDFNAISSSLNGEKQWRIKIINCEIKEDYIEWISKNPLKVIVELPSPVYEEINYNPLEVYSDVTHISTNSAIPTNIVVKNHGYNLVALKENTQYTLYVNKDTTNTLTYRLGDYIEINSPSKFTFTTPETLTDKTLRIDGKGAKVKDLMLIEGTPTNDPIKHFDGLKSSYECEQVTDENDENYGKYKVNIKVVGKNLYDINKLYEGYTITPEGSLVTASNPMLATIKLDVSNLQGHTLVKSGGNKGYYRIEDNKNNFITGGNSRTITIPTGSSILYWYVSTNKDNQIQIEIGNSATEYEPYFESKQTVYLNSPLLKGDEIVWKDNKIQHYHKMETIVLDGSDDENTIIGKDMDDTYINTIEFFIKDVISGKAICECICDKFNYEFVNSDNEHYYTYAVDVIIFIAKSKLQTPDVAGLKQWLQQNPITVVYPLETPYYEEISDYPLKLNVIANSSLSTESTIQVTNISFNIYEETLPYLYPNTKYYITFNADVDRNNIVIDLGGNHVVFDCKVGFNKVEITTPSDTTNLLTFSGTGVNIDHVKVTQQDIDEYFEGMKSVGECESNTVEISTYNSMSLISANPKKWKVQPNDTRNLEYVDYIPCELGDEYSLLHEDIQWIKIHEFDENYTFLEKTQNKQHSFTFSITNPNTKFFKVYIDLNTDFNRPHYIKLRLFKGTKDYGYSYVDELKQNTQQLTHEPLRSIGDVKDRYTLIDGKWYIERNCAKGIIDGTSQARTNPSYLRGDYFIMFTKRIDHPIAIKNNNCKSNDYKTSSNWSSLYHTNEEAISCVDSALGIGIKIANSKTGITSDDENAQLTEKLLNYFQANPVEVIYQLETPQYEPIDYNPFETYSDVTHITTNSLIPTNIVVKNHGYNCLLKPSTKYTVALNKPNGTISAKLGGSAKVDSTNSIFTITTPSTLNDNVLRLSGSGNVKDIMILEGDKTVNTPSYFEGIESVFEQEYDAEVGKYRVIARVANEDKTQESNVIFYIEEPLRGNGTAKDKVYVKDDKVMVQRNCGSVTFDGSDDEGWIYHDLEKTGKYAYRTPFFKSKAKAQTSVYCNNFASGNPSSAWIHNYNNIAILHTGDCHIYCDIRTLNEFKQWLQQNPTTVVYQLAEPVYELADCDLSKLVLENYENSSLIFESNIPVSANIKYSGEVPVVTQAKSLSSQVDNTTLDINENIIPYMCDIDYRIVELQLMNGDTQGEGIELLGIGDIEILSNENVLFNNREDKKYNYSYDMLKRDILSQRYSKEEYQYRLDRYLLANKISNEEYKELEGLLNNGE